jgi:hypothetical protein
MVIYFENNNMYIEVTKTYGKLEVFLHSTKPLH